jgi:ABC-type nitrate/sulfonate/bicarbonate transport system substrate-binding protein
LSDVRFGLSSLDVAALPIYADATGAFAARGITAKIQRDLGHPGEVIEMVAAGALDVGYADIVSSMRALQRGLPVRLLAPGGLYDAAEPIVVLVRAPSSSVRTAADLAGRVVVTPAEHDLARLGVRRWLDVYAAAAPRPLFSSGRKMAGAGADLNAGNADAYIISEPQRTIQRDTTVLLATPFDTIASRFIMGAYVASNAWAEREPATAGGVAQVLRETARWANANRHVTGPLLAERLSFDPVIVAAMSRAAYADAFRPAWLAPVLNAAAEYGEIEPQNGTIDER